MARLGPPPPTFPLIPSLGDGTPQQAISTSPPIIGLDDSSGLDVWRRTSDTGVNDHWSVRGEYRFSDFGQLDGCAFFFLAGLLFTTNRQLAQHQVQVGFSYKFERPLRP